VLDFGMGHLPAELHTTRLAVAYQDAGLRASSVRATAWLAVAAPTIEITLNER